jgi:flavin-dependent dehydrogenase
MWVTPTDVGRAARRDGGRTIDEERRIMTEHYDAIVVGARVAGAATALVLARAGRRVLVLERSGYGTDILSTHAFMRGGVMQLSRLGLLDELTRAGTPAIRRTVIRYGDVEQVVDIRPSPHVDALYAPRRTLLDRVIVDAAIEAGADVRFRTTVTGLRRADDGTVTGVLARGSDGRTYSACAPITIGADGIRSRVAREVGAPPLREAGNASAMLVGYYDDIEVDGYQWLYAEGLGAGLIPTNDGQVCVWVGLPAARFDGTLRARQVLGFHEILHAVAPDWSAALAGARRLGPLRGYPGVRGYMRRAWGPGWALVGDASHFKDPLTTHGMTDALRDAELLARAVLDASDGPGSPARAFDDYERTRDLLSTELFELTDRAASFSWDLAELRDLLIEISAAMRPEVDHLLGLDTATPARLAMVAG